MFVRISEIVRTTDDDGVFLVLVIGTPSHPLSVLRPLLFLVRRKSIGFLENNQKKKCVIILYASDTFFSESRAHNLDCIRYRETFSRSHSPQAQPCFVLRVVFVRRNCRGMHQHGV